MSTQTPFIQNITGIQLPKDACVVIVQTEWNESTIRRLNEGCVSVLSQHQVAHQTITVPGAFEITHAIAQHWSRSIQKVNAYIALGCVIQGDTPHFDYVCKAVTDGVLQLNISLPIPTIFGVLTVNNQQQADERLGGIHGHKGEEAALTALKMISLFQQS